MTKHNHWQSKPGQMDLNVVLGEITGWEENTKQNTCYCRGSCILPNSKQNMRILHRIFFGFHAKRSRIVVGHRSKYVAVLSWWC